MEHDKDLQLIYTIESNRKKALGLWAVLVFSKGRYFVDELVLQFMHERNRLHVYSSGIGDIPYYLIPDFMDLCYLFIPKEEQERIHKIFVEKGWS